MADTSWTEAWPAIFPMLGVRWAAWSKWNDGRASERNRGVLRAYGASRGLHSNSMLPCCDLTERKPRRTQEEAEASARADLEAPERKNADLERKFAEQAAKVADLGTRITQEKDDAKRPSSRWRSTRRSEKRKKLPRGSTRRCVPTGIGGQPHAQRSAGVHLQTSRPAV